MTALKLSATHLSSRAIMSCFCSATLRSGRGQLMLPTVAIQTPRNSRGVGGAAAALATDGDASAGRCCAGAQEASDSVMNKTRRNLATDGAQMNTDEQ